MPLTKSYAEELALIDRWVERKRVVMQTAGKDITKMLNRRHRLVDGRLAEMSDEQLMADQSAFQELMQSYMRAGYGAQRLKQMIGLKEYGLIYHSGYTRVDAETLEPVEDFRAEARVFPSFSIAARKGMDPQAAADEVEAVLEKWKMGSPELHVQIFEHDLHETRGVVLLYRDARHAQLQTTYGWPKEPEVWLELDVVMERLISAYWME